MVRYIRQTAALAVILLFVCFPAHSFSPEAPVATPAEISVSVNGKHLEYAYPKTTPAGRVIVNYMSICNAFNASFDWDPHEYKLTYRKGRGNVSMFLDAPSAILNDNLIATDQAMIQSDGSLYVPLRFLAESFGALVEWEGKTNTVNITTAPVVFFGDSLTEAFELQYFFATSPVSFINLGFNGITTAGALEKLDRVIASHPSEIYIMLGTNDIWGGIEDDVIMSNYSGILDVLGYGCPFAAITIQSILPMSSERMSFNRNVSLEKINRLNSLLLAEAEMRRYEYADIGEKLSDPFTGALKPDYTTDGIHLSRTAYMKWSELLKTLTDAGFPASGGGFW
ncbi:MAG: stalk domain-containing protein [Eubacteriales bacterium]|nr:stalk domain-containing protein [Eubacteriales bacterium]